MIGDTLVVTDFHRKGAEQIVQALRPRLEKGPVGVSVAGESGSGKSEIAACLAELLDQEDFTSMTLCQDDYFRLPPKSNHEKRMESITWIGPQEVRLDLMDKHIRMLLKGRGPIEKPLVYFEENTIESEQLAAFDYDVVIAEGTYTTLLKNTHVHAFIDLDYTKTKLARLKRARDPDSEFIEQVLMIEHGIISEHKKLAQVIITGDHGHNPEEIE